MRRQFAKLKSFEDPGSHILQLSKESRLGYKGDNCEYESFPDAIHLAFGIEKPN